MSDKVLVTGGAGFIGHALIEKLLIDTDYEVLSLDRLDYSGNLNRISNMMSGFDDNDKKRVQIIHHDLKAEINNLVSNKIKDVKHVFHLAASSHVDRAIEDPLSFVYDNVVATCNILNFSKNLNNLESFFYFSTDEVFGPAGDGIKYKEWDRYNSTNPYSASKAGGEELAISFDNTYDLPVIITHCMNVFGKRQHPEKYIPNTIYKLLNDEKITIHSDKNNNPGSRHYIHSHDVADAVLHIINNHKELKSRPVDNFGAKCLKVNIASDLELNNFEVAELVANCLNKKFDYEFVDVPSNRPGHDLRYALDNSVLKNIGWKPEKSSTEGIEKIVGWYAENQEWLTY